MVEEELIQYLPLSSVDINGVLDMRLNSLKTYQLQ